MFTICKTNVSIKCLWLVSSYNSKNESDIVLVVLTELNAQEVIGYNSNIVALQDVQKFESLHFSL